MDWGDADDWEVDKKAEKLTKSLFGKPIKGSKSIVKADAKLDNSHGIANVGGDSDDDDEKLSKKAKKKLKERKRRENKRNKKRLPSKEDGKEESNENNEGDATKETLGKTKKKQKLKDNKVQPSKESTNNSSGENIDNDSKEKTKRKRNRKRKSSDGDKAIEHKEGDGKKKVKVNEENVGEKSEDNDEIEKKKRKRPKKKKTDNRRNRNKFAHLGVKSKVTDLDETNSGSAEGEGKDKAKSSPAVEHNENGLKVKENKGKKRQRSLSPDKSQIKKMKLNNETGKIAVSKKETKKMKKQQSLLSIGKTEEEMVPNNDEHANKSTKNKKARKSKSVVDSVSENGEGNTKLTKNQNTEPVKQNGEDKELTKSKKKRKSKKEKQQNGNDDAKDDEIKTKASPFLVSGQGNELQQKVTDKLASARFRFINEQLYTIKGGEAFRMFQQDKTLMNAYDTGFQGQVKQWSVNPLDVIIKQIGAKTSNLVVADFGCGQARLSGSVKHKVHSFDLYPLNKRITVCDMSKTPLANGSVDIAIFCLSLMGTNLSDYLVEANRVLKEGGLLKIAEVVSRFTNVNHFVKAVSGIGFKPLNTRELSTMFYLMDFKKVKTVEKLSKQAAPISLKPCVYKKR